MGVIHRQGLKSLIINILSMLLGIINVLFVYPLFLGLYGSMQMLISLLKLLSPFSLWGLVSVINKFHAHFREVEFKGFLKFILTWFIVSFSLFSVLYFLFVPYLVTSGESIFPFMGILKNNLLPIWVLLLIYGLILIFSNISNIHKRIVVPSLLVRVIQSKIFFPLLLAVASFGQWKEGLFIWGMAFVYSVILVVLVIYTHRNNWLVNGGIWLDEQIVKYKETISYGTFGILNESGLYLAFSIDIILVYLLLGDSVSGAYAIFLFLATLVRLPSDSISGLILPIVSTLIKNKEFNEIKDYYKRISTGLFVVSLSIFLMLFLSIEDILVIMHKEELVVARFILLFIGAGILVNSMTYMNGTIIVQSKMYRWNIIFILILALLNLILTYLFIKYLFVGEYQSAGAACSTAISLILFNIIKTAFVYYNWKIHPFTKNIIYTSLVGILCYFILSMISFHFSPYINIVLRGLLLSILFFTPILYFRISKDLNVIVEKYYNKFLIS